MTEQKQIDIFGNDAEPVLAELIQTRNVASLNKQRCSTTPGIARKDKESG